MLSTLQKIIGSPLRTRFLLYFVILTTVPVLILGGVVLTLIDISHRRDVSALEMQLVNQKIEETEKFLDRTLGTLELVVGYEQKIDIDLAQQNFFLDGLLADNDAFEEVSFISVFGETVGKETAKKNKTGTSMELFAVPLLPKFTETKEGRTYIGEVYYTLTGPFVTMSAPVRNRNGVVVEVLSAEVYLGDVVYSVESAFFGERGSLVLVDRNGRLLAKRESKMVQGSSVRNIYSVERVLANETVDGLHAKDRYVSFFSKEPVVASGRVMPKMGWAFIAEWPLSDADAVMNGVRDQVMTLTLASILGVLFLAPLVAARLTKPINALKLEAQEIEQGNFDKEVVITTHDELEELGFAFNRMAKGLKRLEELKSEFVYIATHELRAPVTAIKGYISLLVEGREQSHITAEASEFIDRINKANEGLVRLVDNLLEIARSDAGKIEISVKPVNIGEVTQDVIKTLSVLADKKGIKIEHTSTDTMILADVEKLSEVLMNLVSNAIKYTLGSGTITIQHVVQDALLVTHVRDTGMGISLEAQKKLFEKFYRVKAKGAEDIKGTGLGLFIVKQLVEKMGGKIWVVSEEGKGSTFSFSLPLSV